MWRRDYRPSKYGFTATRGELDKYHIPMLLPVSRNMASCHALSTSQLAVLEANVNSLCFLQIEFQFK